MLHCQIGTVETLGSTAHWCTVIHIHLHHVHQRREVRHIEVLDIVARRLLGGYEIDVVIARVQSARLGISKYVVLAIDNGRQLWHNLDGLQETVHLQCLLC